MRTMHAPCLLQKTAVPHPYLQSAVWACVTPPRLCIGAKHLHIPHRKHTSGLCVRASDSGTDSVEVSAARAKAKTADEALSVFLSSAELFCIAAAGGLQVHCCLCLECTCSNICCLISVKVSYGKPLAQTSLSCLDELHAKSPARPALAGGLLQVAVLLVQQQQAAQQQASSAADSRKTARAMVRLSATTAVPEVTALHTLQILRALNVLPALREHASGPYQTQVDYIAGSGAAASGGAAVAAAGANRHGAGGRVCAHVQLAGPRTRIC